MENTFNRMMRNLAFSDFLSAYVHTANYFVASSKDIEGSDRVDALLLSLAHAFEAGVIAGMEIKKTTD